MTPAQATTPLAGNPAPPGSHESGSGQAPTDHEQAGQNEMVRRAQTGDLAAYQALYQQHHRRVYALCFRLTADRGLAEDATQEVFIQLWQKLANFNGQSLFSTWLHSVTANVTISLMRRQKGWVARMLNLEDSSAQHQDAPGCPSQVDLEGLVLRLPERARLVFVLHAIEGYRHEEIARMLNMAAGSSKAHFHRARQLLTQWMEQQP